LEDGNDKNNGEDRSRVGRVRASGGLVSGDEGGADQEGWNGYETAKWLTMRRWLDANPDDDFAGKKSEPTRCWNLNATPRIRVNTSDGVCSRWGRGDAGQLGYSADGQRLGRPSYARRLDRVRVHV